MSDKPYTVRDLADRWDCDEDHILELIESGALRAFTIGAARRRGSYRITRDAELEYLNRSEPALEVRDPVLKGFIYFAGHGKYLKIGFTALNDWRRRIAGIQTSNPEPIRVWRVFAADAMTEGVLHEALKDYRVGGEWFTLGDEGKAVALSIMSGFTPVFEGG